MTKLLKDETADSLRSALISLIAEYIPTTGASVQVDCATAFQSLANESNKDGSTLKSLHIEILMGRTMNTNKNPIAENAIKEFHKERLKLDPQGGKINELQLVLITKNMNSRICDRGLSAKEIVYQRDQVSNLHKKIIPDDQLSELQFNRRKESHNTPSVQKEPHYVVGDLVFMRNGMNKLKGREMFRILDIYFTAGESWAKLQKNEDQFRSKSYDVKLSEIIPIKGFSKGQSQMQNAGEVLTKCSNKDIEPTAAKQNEVILQPKNHEPCNYTEAKRQPYQVTPDPTQNKQRRKAAIQAEENTKNLAAQGVLKIGLHPLKKQIATHGWNWEDFSYLCDMYFESRTRTKEEDVKKTADSDADH